MTDGNIRQLPRLAMSDAMRLFGLTARAIRFYEERGLIEARRDRLNHRYYDASARRRLAWIAPLRAAGLGLGDISCVLAVEDRGGDGVACAIAMLKHRRADLAAELAKIDRTMNTLDNHATPSARAHDGIQRC
jgi:DNA-binding transcriptional MerR regulator